MPLSVFEGVSTFVQIVLINESREADLYLVPVEKIHFDEWEALNIMHDTFKAPYIDVRWTTSKSSPYTKHEKLLRFLLFNDHESEYETKSSWEQYRHKFDPVVSGLHLVTNIFILQDTDCSYW